MHGCDGDDAAQVPEMDGEKAGLVVEAEEGSSNSHQNCRTDLVESPPWSVTVSCELS